MANNPKKNYFDLTGQQGDESESTLRLKLKDETAIKQKLFFSLVTLAQELKRLRAETQPLQDAMKYANRSWYEGGMWRPPAILPGVVSTPTKSVLREATTPSGLFFHLVIVTALTRVGISFANQRSLTLDSVLYFAVFWMIWTKDLGYGTRFDTTDLSYEVVNLLTCIAVLMGSLTATAQLDSAGATRVMIMGAFVAILHCLLHIRVAYWFQNANPNSIEADARKHAIFSIAMTLCEASTWILGLIIHEPFQRRWIVFLIAIAFSIARFPRTFPNDFHAASSKRTLLFVLLIGFLFQSVVIVASPFFEYQSPTFKQSCFLGACAIMLYCIKLLYSDDIPKSPQDHALLVSGVSAFFFNVGQFTLLMSTTLLGSGLDLLTHSYLAATTSLPQHAKEMVCGGYAAVLMSILFLKSLHLKRIPIDRSQRCIFIGTICTQTVVFLAVIMVASTLAMGMDIFGIVAQDELTLMLSLACISFFLVILSWLDEAIELSMYQESDSQIALVHPFGLWWFMSYDDISDKRHEASFPTNASQALSGLTPLLSASVANLTYESVLNEDV